MGENLTLAYETFVLKALTQLKPLYREVSEGGALVYAPDPVVYVDSKGRPAPWKAPVFYNPRGSLTRDLSVAITRRAGSNIQFLDTMCGIGVRGLRISLLDNVDHSVLNDVNPWAVALTYLGVERNSLIEKVDIQSFGVNALCAASDYRTGYDYVDLDPFGSAAPFVPAVLLSVRNGGHLGVCSTDAANLCGNRPNALKRIYFAFNRDSMSKKETGLRILIGYVVQRAATMGFAAEPVLCYQYADYFRCHFQISHSFRQANRLIQKMGYKTGCSEHSPFSEKPFCEVCNKPAEAGPLWTGSFLSEPFLKEVSVELKLVRSNTIGETKRLVEALLDEQGIDHPYIDVHRILKRSGLNPPKKKALIQSLLQSGFKAASTHFSPTGIRTNAPIQEVKRVCLSLQ
jgi:tRNA (guanine26-N2/guanine27-N2)-dimethyltransferase